ncbi:nuclear transport factor 2 family protein [Mycobacterium sp. SMC-8]|uniref:nuclear transport factor 2 family protein n=1 Tax=Mycobacterium sp. SMC-8 TaxID=2857060 RepID=UPI0021B2AD4A|nr:nuclear transport factor 2 family protein [Mycobacterium sp. SMC-8]UXA11841.1 nuclear transport factor 2 family protein [Mycobacterium sp. SMC-8]
MTAEGGYAPSPADVEDVLAWFARYDALAVAKDIEGMADQAMFPLNEVTDGRAESCDRDRFVAQMTQELGGAGDVFMESVRTPHFINENLVFVITDATITVDGHSQQVRYGDLLVRSRSDGWKFQTMVQGGWGDS